VKVECADQVDGGGAGELRGQVPRRGGGEAEEAPAIQRAAGGGGGEEEEAEEHDGGAPSDGPHGPVRRWAVAGSKVGDTSGGGRASKPTGGECRGEGLGKLA
jgi:hypothetical protein